VQHLTKQVHGIKVYFENWQSLSQSRKPQLYVIQADVIMSQHLLVSPLDTILKRAKLRHNLSLLFVLELF